jgi:twinkle protein
METETESLFIEHSSCSSCNSSDANAIYSDHSFCFACEKHVNLTDSGEPITPIQTAQNTTTSGVNFIKGDYQALRKRGISEQTCRALGYSVGEYQGKPCHIAPITDSKGRLVAQKLRLPGKDFRVLGDLKAGGLVFQNKCKSSGKRLVITEGEIDALSYATVAPDWPVVSLPNGCAGGVKAVKKSLEFCEGFDEVVLLLDSDEPGRAAALEIAALLSPGKCKIAELPLKDANEMLVAGRVSDLKHAVYNAKLFSPEGIVQGHELTVAELQAVTPKGCSIPFPQLQSMIRGLRKRELVMVCAGSGIGKSTFTRELGYHLAVEHGQKVGYVMLEESVAKTAQAMIAIDNNVPLGDLMEDPTILTQDQWDTSFEKVVKPSAFYDSFGSSEIDKLLSKVRYLAVGLGCDFVVLDHMSMVTAAGHADERKSLDELMVKSRSLVENTGIGLIAVSHIKRGSGDKSYNEGAQISLTSLRGSAALEQLSDVCIALERDQQSETEGDIAQIRLIKNRPFGQVGPAGHLMYDVATGRQKHYDKQDAPPQSVDGFDPFDDVPF